MLYIVSSLCGVCRYFFFFFSSRRRHTRLTCDWSSDVCSSDLWRVRQVPAGGLHRHRPAGAGRAGAGHHHRSEERRVGEEGRSTGGPDYLKKKKKKETHTDEKYRKIDIERMGGR